MLARFLRIWAVAVLIFLAFGTVLSAIYALALLANYLAGPTGVLVMGGFIAATAIAAAIALDEEGGGY